MSARFSGAVTRAHQSPGARCAGDVDRQEKLGEVRLDVVRRARERLLSGYYDREDVVDEAVDRLIEIRERVLAGHYDQDEVLDEAVSRIVASGTP